MFPSNIFCSVPSCPIHFWANFGGDHRSIQVEIAAVWRCDAGAGTAWRWCQGARGEVVAIGPWDGDLEKWMETRTLNGWNQWRLAKDLCRFHRISRGSEQKWCEELVVELSWNFPDHNHEHLASKVEQWKNVRTWTHLCCPIELLGLVQESGSPQFMAMSTRIQGYLFSGVSPIFSRAFVSGCVDTVRA